MKRFHLLLALALLAPWAAQAQTTCAAAPADPIARDAVRLAWQAPATWIEGGAIVGPLTYTVHELVGTTWVARCTTASLSAGLAGLSVGAHTWAVTARTPASFPPNVDGLRSNSASKTIDPPPLTPGAPVTFTVTGAVTITGTITLTPQ